MVDRWSSSPYVLHLASTLPSLCLPLQSSRSWRAVAEYCHDSIMSAAPEQTSHLLSVSALQFVPSTFANPSLVCSSGRFVCKLSSVCTYSTISPPSCRLSSLCYHPPPTSPSIPYHLLPKRLCSTLRSPSSFTSYSLLFMDYEEIRRGPWRVWQPFCVA